MSVPESSFIVYPTANGIGNATTQATLGDGKYLRETYLRQLYILGLLNSNFIISTSSSNLTLNSAGTEITTGEFQIQGYYFNLTTNIPVTLPSESTSIYLYLSIAYTAQNLIESLSYEVTTTPSSDITSKLCLGHYSYTTEWTLDTSDTYRDSVKSISAVPDADYTSTVPISANTVKSLNNIISNSSGTSSYKFKVYTPDSGTTYNLGLYYNDGSTPIAYITPQGYFTPVRSVNPYAMDYAELYPKYDLEEYFEEGDVVVKVPNSLSYTKCSKLNDSLVVGIVSNRYGYALGGSGDSEEDVEKFIPVALVGEVPIKVIGIIKEGDLLTTSNLSGIATRSDNYYPGTIIGKAKESYNSKYVGKIMAQVFLG